MLLYTLILSIVYNTIFLLKLFAKCLYKKHSIKRIVCEELANHNVLCVKLFQTFAPFNSDLLEQFTNNVPVSDYELITLKHFAQNGHGKTLKLLNAGSIAVVFETDDQQMVIKVLRNNIRNKITFQLDELICWLTLLKPFGQIFSHIQKTAIKCSKTLIKQTNICKEHQNLCDVYAKMSTIPYCHIPQPIGTFNDTSLIMTKLTDCMPCIKQVYNNADDKLRMKWAINLTKFGIVSTLIHGIAHGDLHAGNILLYLDGTIGLVDFGIVFKFSTEFCEDMLLLMSSIDKFNDTTTLAEKISKSKLFKTSTQKTIDTINIALTKFTKNSAEIVKMIYYLFDVLSIKEISDEFKKLQLSLLTTQGISLKLCGDKYIDVINQATEELFGGLNQSILFMNSENVSSLKRML